MIGQGVIPNLIGTTLPVSKPTSLYGTVSTADDTFKILKKKKQKKMKNQNTKTSNLSNQHI
jgi:hypothetical protein